MSQQFFVWRPWQRIGVFFQLLEYFAVVPLAVLEGFWLLARRQIAEILLDVAARARATDGL